LVNKTDIRNGTLYPSLAEIRNLSLEIATAVADKAFDLGIARNDRPKNLKQFIKEYMYDPCY
jgi:malate dehydrogenase (oxaloacetate-decarboxylating)(NADP+)